jgi:hypothetical protein
MRAVRQTERQKNRLDIRRKESLFAILRTRLKMAPPRHKQKCYVLRQADGLMVSLQSFFPPKAQEPPVCLGLLIIEASRSHSDTPHSVGLLCTSDQPVAQTST